MSGQGGSSASLAARSRCPNPARILGLPRCQRRRMRSRLTVTGRPTASSSVSTWALSPGLLGLKRPDQWRYRRGCRVGRLRQHGLHGQCPRRTERQVQAAWASGRWRIIGENGSGHDNRGKSDRRRSPQLPQVVARDLDQSPTTMRAMSGLGNISSSQLSASGWMTSTNRPASGLAPSK